MTWQQAKKKDNSQDRCGDNEKSNISNHFIMFTLQNTMIIFRNNPFI